MRSKKLYILTTAFVFFFVSVGSFWYWEKRPMQPERLHFKLGFDKIQPVKAAASQWGAVRGIATFVKDATEAIDTIIVNLTSSGLLNSTSDVTFNDGTYKYKFSPSANVTVTPKGSGSATTYTYRFIVWSASDNSKILELFFDSPTERTSGDGVAAVWWPRKFQTGLKSSSGKMECVTSVVSSNNTMICSWSEGPFVSSGVTRTGQIHVTDNTTNGTVDFKAAIRTNGQTSCSGTLDYYGLAFISKSASPYYTTAEFSYEDNAITVTSRGKACSITPNPYNYGFFNVNSNASSTGDDKYFVSDSATTVPSSDYPSTSDVDTLFAEITGSNKPSKTSVDALQTSPVDFLDSTTSTPGF